MATVYSFMQNIRMLAAIEKAFVTRSVVLKLVDFNIKEVPISITKIFFLMKLYLSKNEIRELPEEIMLLRNLVTLALDYNRITKLPNLSGFQQLAQLNISNNPIGNIPSEIGSLCTLEVLWLNNTNIKYLPMEIGNLINLETLGARGNNLESLPDEICNLVKLKWLTFERNEISFLPDDFSNLLHLTHVNFSKNCLKEIPPSLIALKELQYCFLANNEISIVSEDLLNDLRFLKKLDIQSNKLLHNINKKLFPFVVDESDEDDTDDEDDDSVSEDWEASVPTSEINTSESEDDQEDVNVHDAMITWVPFIAKMGLNSSNCV